MEDKLCRIVDGLTGVSRREWEIIRQYIDREFDAAARRVVFSEDMGVSALRCLANEAGLGKVVQPERRK